MTVLASADIFGNPRELFGNLCTYFKVY